MLILLLLAKGWAVTRQQISKTSWLILMSIWIPYCAFHVVLYVWNRVRNNYDSLFLYYDTWILVFYSDRGGHYIGHWRVSNVAGMVGVGVSHNNNAVVFVGTSEHHEIWAFNQEIGFFIAFRCKQFSVVHLFANCGHRSAASQSDVAIQIVVR